ncbi:MAG: YraN family protein [Actinobacteria bacterium]|nr:YraN family protein [Actinomycetota bacterium]
MARSSRAIGVAGEALASRHYEAQGWKVAARNWRLGREGELDLVVTRNGEVVFCEVKTRSGTAFGTPAEAVGARKQAQIRRLAAAWLASAGVRPRGIRFDVASVMWPAGADPSVEIIEGAF